MGKWAAHLAQSRWSVSWDIYLFGVAWSSSGIDAEVRQMMIWSWLAKLQVLLMSGTSVDVRCLFQPPEVWSSEYVIYDDH
jgi:hypothetical protein